MKFWILADARNYYPLNIEVYAGENISLSNKPEDVTLRLTSNLSQGHVIVGDSYFTSLQLSNRLLKEKNLFYLGTINRIRGEIPLSLQIVNKGVSLYSSKFTLASEIL